MKECIICLKKLNFWNHSYIGSKMCDDCEKVRDDYENKIYEKERDKELKRLEQRKTQIINDKIRIMKKLKEI